MLHSFILTLLLVVTKGLVKPAPESIPLKSNSGPPSAKDFYISSRRILPMAAFGGASHIAMLGLFMHAFDLMDGPDAIGPLLLYVGGGLYTGLFSGISIRCAEKLVEAYNGPPQDLAFRNKLIRELTVFPLLPLIVASVI